LKDNVLINIGEAYCVINMISGPLLEDQDLRDILDDHKHNMIHLPSDFDENNDYDDGRQRLKFKIFGGPSAGEVYYFRPTDEIIVVGRTPECEIRINDKLLSKCQAHLQYVAEDDQWVMCDGLHSKPSTNGTWLYIKDDHPISSGMVFKANQTIFTAQLI